MNMMVMRGLFLAVVLGVACSLVSEGAVARKVIGEVIEQAAKQSGKALTPASKKIMSEAMEAAVKRYGDDALRAVSKGGLEVLEQGGKHSDLFWRYCMKDGGKYAAVLAKNADSLMPLVKRVGPEVLEFELKHSGLAAKAIASFGDDAVKLLAKAPVDDVTRLVGYANRADNPATRNLLFDTYKKSARPSVFLKALDWKHIMAFGLSAATITAAYKVSDGMEEGIKTMAKESPHVLATSMTVWCVIMGLGGMALVGGWLVWRFKPLRPKKTTTTK